ncbi:MAG TPA: acyl carrier protein [Anaerolineales bacterium]|nr:acyl carrier protein [Anaerolineales bacterium]
MDTQKLLLEYITKELAIGRAKEVRPEDDLLAAGILDSLGLMQLVMFLEEKLGVKVPDEDVVIENFQSVDALQAYLERRNGHAA